MQIFYNGHIYVDGKYEEAIVEDQGKIVFVGKNQKAFNYLGEYIDLKGKYILPGFNDSHMHLLGLGKYLKNLDLSKHTNSLKDLLDYLRTNIKTDNWLIGRGWNHDYFDDYDGFLTRQHLDQVSKDIPIFMMRACGHVAAVNTQAFKYIQLRDIEGGSIDQENGLFFENAIELINEAIEKPTVSDIEDYILLAQQKLNSYGITSVQSDDFVSVTDNYQDVITAYQNLENKNQLTIRIHEQCQFLDYNLLKQFYQNDYQKKQSHMFQFGPLKIIGDGSLGARTALLSQPYHDNPYTKGVATLKYKELKHLMTFAHQHHIPLAIHVIGDGILDQVLDIFEQFNFDNEKYRHGLVHVQITREDQLEKIAEMKLHCYIQSIFLDYDSHIVQQRVGDKLAKTSYQFKYLYDHTSLSNGSDCPVEMPDVLKGMQLAITRQTCDGKKIYEKSQALTRQEALKSFTINASYASFEEKMKGELKPGMLCDFVVLDEDIFKVDELHIQNILILATYLGGKKVYERQV